MASADCLSPGATRRNRPVAGRLPVQPKRTLAHHLELENRMLELDLRVSLGYSCSWIRDTHFILCEVRVLFPAQPNFLRSSGSGICTTQPREYNCGATWKKK
jgi:hypothetical protein